MGDQVIPAGHRLGEAGLLFEKIEDAQIQAQVDKLLATKKANELAAVKAAPAKANISFEDFSKMDIRVGKIIAAEKVAKTKKLMKLTVDTGIDQRTVVSGIAGILYPGRSRRSSGQYIGELRAETFERDRISRNDFNGGECRRNSFFCSSGKRVKTRV